MSGESNNLEISSIKNRDSLVMITCVVCNHKNPKKVSFFKITSQYEKKEYDLYRCRNCGFIRPHPLPYDESTKYRIYDEEGITACYDPQKRKIVFDSKESFN